MNYRKTKTIKKQGTINRGGLLSSLLLFFLVVSCNQHNNNNGGHHNRPHHHKGEASNQEVKAKFLEWLGAWGPCKDVCFLSQLRNDAINSGEKTKRVGGIESYKLPKNSPNDDKKSYFEGLVHQDVVAGTEEGRKKWRDKIRLRRNKKQTVGQLREGLYGVMKEVVETGLSSTGGSFTRSTGLYVIDQYMKFQQGAEEVLQNNTNKDEIALLLNKKLDALKEGLNKVKAGAKGVTLVVPVQPDNTTAENNGIYFVDRSEKGNSGLTEKKKHFTLTKKEEVKFNKINENIKAKIDALVQELN